MNINKINVSGVEYDIQDKKTLDYLNQQLDYIYDKEEVDARIKEATQNKASTEYVDNALSNIDLSNYYNKEETENKIDEVLDNVETLEDKGIFICNIPIRKESSKTINSTTTEFVDTFNEFNKILKIMLFNYEKNTNIPKILFVKFIDDVNYGTDTKIFLGTKHTANKILFYEKGASPDNEFNPTSSLTLEYSENNLTSIIYAYQSVTTKGKLLTTKNNQMYDVSSNYIPAHKKYVDDSINTAIGDINTILDNINGEVL